MAGFGSLAPEIDWLTGLPIPAFPNVGEPLVGSGGEFSRGTDLGNKAAGFGANLGQAVLSIPKAVMWDLPHKLVGHSIENQQPGLRREDFTDLPPNTTPDPKSPLGGIGVQFGRIGWQPVDPMVGGSLEAATNVMGGTALSAPSGAVVGAGPRMVDAADQLKELANLRRSKGWATGKSAEGHDFRRPDPPPGTPERIAAEQRGAMPPPESPPSPYMTQDDIDFMGGPTFGAGAADKRAAGAAAALDMSTEARMARAAEQGYTRDAYHGTLAEPFDAFKRKRSDIGIHFGSADQANDRISYMADMGRAGEPHVYPVKLKVNNPLRLPDLGSWDSDNLWYGLRNLRNADGTPMFDLEELRKARFSSGNEAGRTAAMRDLVERKGYDGIVYRNTGETGGSEPYRQALKEARERLDEAFGGRKYSFTPAEQQHPAYVEWRKADASYDRHREQNAEDSFIAFRPQQVRSTQAAFDPANEGKGMLLGAGAADKRAAGAALAADAERTITPPPAAPVVPEAADWYAAVRGAAHDPIPETALAGQAPAPPAAVATAADAGLVGPGGGGQAGIGGLEQAQAAAARWAGARKPLEGLPGALKIGDQHFVPGPIARVHDVAEEYMKGTGRPYTPPERYYPIDPEHSKAIAQAYEEMKHTPKDPATIASYNALIDETMAQYQAIKKSGLKIEPIPPGMPDPYAKNPRLAAIDVAENNHLWFFPTEGGFGTVNKITDNPMLRKTGEKIGDHELLANDMFRVVHDYFGHLKQGHGFRAAGEDNAWRGHSAMYSDLARPAMTTETRGQNSWVNYGPHGDKNRTASGADTVYADQKVGLMPDWTMYDRGKEPIYAYHGSPHKFDKFSTSKIGEGEGNAVYGRGLYFAESPKVADKYRSQLATQPYSLNGSPVKWDDVVDDLSAAINKVGDISPDHRRAIIHEITNAMDRGDSPKKILGNVSDYPSTEKFWRAAVDQLKKYDYSRKPGASYKVAIEAPPEQFLDWDAALKGQTPYVQERVADDMIKSVARQKEALARSVEKIRETGGRYPNTDLGRMRRDRDMFDMQKRLATLDAQELSGREIYKRMGLPARDQDEAWERATEALRARDIPGLRYLDQHSRLRTRGKTTSNFVVFDDKLLRILRRYGIAGLPAGAAGFGSLAPREE